MRDDLTRRLWIEVNRYLKLEVVGGLLLQTRIWFLSSVEEKMKLQTTGWNSPRLLNL
jgi:hypothetical protein